MPAPQDTVFCSDFSREAGEQLCGTVKLTTTWFLLEYEDRWYPEAFEQSDLPEAVKAPFSVALESDPQKRFLMIRQKPRLAPEGIAFYVTLTRETESALYAFQVSRYEDLLALDIAAICAEDPAYDAYRVTDPIFLVCTHGRRDKCCARRGIPVYERIAERGAAMVWQTSHVGGHRFAANVVCLPEGIVYGRVDPTRAESLVDEYHAGQLMPDILRGRTAYSKQVQAAEALLRLEIGETARDAFRLVGDGAEADDAIRFKSIRDGATHAVYVEAQATLGAYASCGDESRTDYAQYRLQQHIVE
jgi:hypothetical protein